MSKSATSSTTGTGLPHLVTVVRPTSTASAPPRTEVSSPASVLPSETVSLLAHTDAGEAHFLISTSVAQQLDDAAAPLRTAQPEGRQPVPSHGVPPATPRTPEYAERDALGVRAGKLVLNGCAAPSFDSSDASLVVERGTLHSPPHPMALDGDTAHAPSQSPYTSSLSRASRRTRTTTRSRSNSDSGVEESPARSLDGVSAHDERADGPEAVCHAPLASCEATSSTAALHRLGNAPCSSSSNAVSDQASISASSTPNNIRDMLRSRVFSSSLSLSRVSGDARTHPTVLSASLTSAASSGGGGGGGGRPTRHADAYARSGSTNDTSGHAHISVPLPVYPGSIHAESGAGSAGLHPTIPSAAYAFRAPPRPTPTPLGTTSTSSWNSSLPSFNASVLRDRCGDMATTPTAATAAGAALAAASLTSHAAPVTESEHPHSALRQDEGSSRSTAPANAYSSSSDGVSLARAGVGSPSSLNAAAFSNAGSSFSWRMFSTNSLALHRGPASMAGGTDHGCVSGFTDSSACPVASLGIFQSGLFLSLDDDGIGDDGEEADAQAAANPNGDGAPAGAAGSSVHGMEGPMTPQSFSTLVLARDASDGALHTSRCGGGGLGSLSTSVAALARARTPSWRAGASASPVLPSSSVETEETSVLARNASRQPTSVSGGAEDAWGTGEDALTGELDRWCGDNTGSGDSRTTGTTMSMGPPLPMSVHFYQQQQQQPPLGALYSGGNVSAGGGARYPTPLGSLQLPSCNSQRELPRSGVDMDDIPGTPNSLEDLVSLVPPSRRRHSHRRRSSRSGEDGNDEEADANAGVDAETGVVETYVLDRARAVSRDGVRAYEVVNEKYVLYDYELGKGSYSSVRLCYNLENRQFCAAKVLDQVRLKRRQLGSEAALSRIDQEITMMKQVQHRNIISLYEVIRDPNHRYVYLMLALAERREALTMRDNGDVVPHRGEKGATTYYAEGAARVMVTGLLHALMYAHYLGVAHRDIKPSNVLLTADGTVKLCDFGVSVLVGDAPQQLSREGSVAFLAPELLASGEVSASRFTTPADSCSVSAIRDRSEGTAKALGLTFSSVLPVNTDSLVLDGADSRRVPRPAGARADEEEEDASGSHHLNPNHQRLRVTPARGLRRVSSLTGGGASDTAASSANPRAVSATSARQRGSDAGDVSRWPGAAASPDTPPLGPCGTLNASLSSPSTPMPSGVLASSSSQPIAHDVRAAAQGHVDLFKADVFALGVTVFTLLFGHLPWRASSATSQLAAILAEPDPFLRLYGEAYGERYEWPARVREACASGSVSGSCDGTEAHKGGAGSAYVTRRQSLCGDRFSSRHSCVDGGVADEALSSAQHAERATRMAPTPSSRSIEVPFPTTTSEAADSETLLPAGGGGAASLQDFGSESIEPPAHAVASHPLSPPYPEPSEWTSLLTEEERVAPSRRQAGTPPSVSWHRRPTTTPESLLRTTLCAVVAQSSEEETTKLAADRTETTTTSAAAVGHSTNHRSSNTGQVAPTPRATVENTASQHADMEELEAEREANGVASAHSTPLSVYGTSIAVSPFAVESNAQACEEDEEADFDNSSSSSSTESCESIYERLFEMEQPCRPYTMAEHTPLPVGDAPSSSGGGAGSARTISAAAVDFVRACLVLDSSDRRTVFELFRHPWIRGVTKEDDEGEVGEGEDGEVIAGGSGVVLDDDDSFGSEASEGTWAAKDRRASEATSSGAENSSGVTMSGPAHGAVTALLHDRSSRTSAVTTAADADQTDEALRSSITCATLVPATSSSPSVHDAESASVMLSLDSEPQLSPRTDLPTTAPTRTAQASGLGPSPLPTLWQRGGVFDPVWCSPFTGAVTPPPALLRHQMTATGAAAAAPIALSPDTPSTTSAPQLRPVATFAPPAPPPAPSAAASHVTDTPFTNARAAVGPGGAAGHTVLYSSYAYTPASATAALEDRVQSPRPAWRPMLMSPRGGGSASVLLSPSAETSAATTPRVVATLSERVLHSDAFLPRSLPVETRGVDRLLLSVNTVSTSSQSTHLDTNAASARYIDARAPVTTPLTATIVCRSPTGVSDGVPVAGPAWMQASPPASLTNVSLLPEADAAPRSASAPASPQLERSLSAPSFPDARSGPESRAKADVGGGDNSVYSSQLRRFLERAL